MVCTRGVKKKEANCERREEEAVCVCESERERENCARNFPHSRVNFVSPRSLFEILSFIFATFYVPRAIKILSQTLLRIPSAAAARYLFCKLPCFALGEFRNCAATVALLSNCREISVNNNDWENFLSRSNGEVEKEVGFYKTKNGKVRFHFNNSMHVERIINFASL